MRNLFKVHPDDFDVKTLMTAAREGRLYIDEIDNEKAHARQLLRRQHEVLAYVSAIEEFVVPEWLPHIKTLWTTLIDDPLFTPHLVLQKGKHQGMLNKYLVTNIVFHLQVLGVYQCNSLLELHKKLEGVDEKNSVYKNARLYSLSTFQRQRLRELTETLSQV